MLIAIFGILFVAFLLFAFVIAFGAPYLPTYGRNIDDAFKLLDLKKGQSLLELGCGDGVMLVEAAKRGINATGIELNPILYLIAKIRCAKYRNKTVVIWGNYWKKRWPLADGVYVFLLDKYMEKLDKNIVQRFSGKKVKLVSYAFKIRSKKPTKTRNGMFLYDY